LKRANVEAADSAKQYRATEQAIETKMMSRGEELERTSAELTTLQEALRVANDLQEALQLQMSEQRTAREAAETQVAATETALETNTLLHGEALERTSTEVTTLQEALRVASDLQEALQQQTLEQRTAREARGLFKTSTRPTLNRRAESLM
jgi:hypothetical protein